MTFLVLLLAYLAVTVDSTLLPFDGLTLGVTGAVEAANSFQLVIALRHVSNRITVILSKGAQNFVAAGALAAIGGVQLISDELHVSGQSDCTETSKWPMLIAPCSANTVAKLAHGIVDNVLIRVALGVCSSLIIAPSMAEMMWTNPRTKRNMNLLMTRGVEVIEPTLGIEVATLQPQFGAMPREAAIVAQLLKFRRERRTLEYKEFRSNGGT